MITSGRQSTTTVTPLRTNTTSSMASSRFPTREINSSGNSSAVPMFAFTIWGPATTTGGHCNRSIPAGFPRMLLMALNTMWTVHWFIRCYSANSAVGHGCSLRDTRYTTSSTSPVMASICSHINLATGTRGPTGRAITLSETDPSNSRQCRLMSRSTVPASRSSSADNPANPDVRPSDRRLTERGGRLPRLCTRRRRKPLYRQSAGVLAVRPASVKDHQLPSGGQKTFETPARCNQSR
jgi:hypothetical protein